MSVTTLAETVKPNPPELGDLYSVNQYALTQLLGKGAFAKVYECRRLEEDAGAGSGEARELPAKETGTQLYAMKVFDKQAIRKIQFVRPGCGNIDRELSVWSRVSGHPNILSLVEVIKDPKSKYVRAVMEHAAGGQLMPDSMMESGKISKGLPLTVVRRVAAQLLDAVIHCHALSVTHRDVKPSNCLLKEPIPEQLLSLLEKKDSSLEDGERRLKQQLLGRITLQLCDFGEAMDVTESPTGSDYTRATTGSPAFNAPEMLSSSLPFSTAKQDGWACGMTLYMLFHGRPAFMSDHLVGLHEAIRNDDLAWSPARRPAGLADEGEAATALLADSSDSVEASTAMEESSTWGDLDDESNPLAWKCAEDLVRRLLTKDPYKRWPVRKARSAHPFVRGIVPLADPVPDEMVKGKKKLIGEETERPDGRVEPAVASDGGGASSSSGAGSLPDELPSPMMPPSMPPIMMMGFNNNKR
jgi:serine/threonine protein kinase